MKWFHRILFLFACMFMVSAIIGIQQAQFSFDNVSNTWHASNKMFSSVDRISTFIAGIFTALWSYGVKKRTTWGKWITIVFFGLAITITAVGSGKAVYDFLTFQPIDLVVFEFVIGILNCLIVIYIFKKIMINWKESEVKRAVLYIDNSGQK